MAVVGLVREVKSDLIYLENVVFWESLDHILVNKFGLEPPDVMRQERRLGEFFVLIVVVLRIRGGVLAVVSLFFFFVFYF